MVIRVRKNEDDLLERTDRLGGWFFFGIEIELVRDRVVEGSRYYIVE